MEIDKGKQMQAIYFAEKESGEWVENGCDKCGRGMTGRIYRFQRENRPQGTICMTCSKKELKKELKGIW
jgi:hypothetical protein